jgi:hypothetical protein
VKAIDANVMFMISGYTALEVLDISESPALAKKGLLVRFSKLFVFVPLYDFIL